MPYILSGRKKKRRGTFSYAHTRAYKYIYIFVDTLRINKEYRFFVRLPYTRNTRAYSPRSAEYIRSNASVFPILERVQITSEFEAPDRTGA